MEVKVRSLDEAYGEKLEKSKQVQVKPFTRKGRAVLGYQRFDPRTKTYKGKEPKEGVTLGDGTRVRLYDSGPNGPADRYVAVLDSKEWDESSNPGFKAMLSFSPDPDHPSYGVSQFGEGKEGKHLGKRIRFTSLPEKLQNHVIARVLSSGEDDVEGHGAKEQMSFYAEPKEQTPQEKGKIRDSRISAMKEFNEELKKIAGVEHSHLDDWTPQSAEEGTIFIRPKVSRQGSSSKRNYRKVPWEFERLPIVLLNEIKRVARKMGIGITAHQLPRKTYRKDKYDAKPMFDGYDEEDIRIEMYPIGKSMETMIFGIDEAHEILEKAYTKGKTGRTEHAGAKHGQGFWGRKAEAKKVSKKVRRQEDKKQTWFQRHGGKLSTHRRKKAYADTVENPNYHPLNAGKEK